MNEKKTKGGKELLLYLLFTAALMLLFTGCGENYIEKAEKEESLTVALTADVDSLHPSDYSTNIESQILDQVYDTLLYMDMSGSKDPEPRLAETWDVSDDGMTYTFHLRKDATFHDGTPVTAQDVVFSLELYQNSNYQNGYVDGLDSAESTDDYTVICHMQHPYSPFLLGVSRVHIASKNYYEASPDTFASRPMGSGPYCFVSREKGSKIILDAYGKYYRGEAAIKHVTFKIIPDATTKAIALQTGEVNFGMIDSSSILALKGNDRIDIERIQSSSFTYVSMNLEKAPYDNQLVRQAINYALDRQTITDICYDGEAEVNSNLCSKERLGYTEEQKKYDYDPEKAKELLKEAGITTPYDLGSMLVPERYSNIATVVQSQLHEVGLEVKIEVKEFNAYISDLTQGNYGITALNMTLEGDTQQMALALTTDYIGMANNARFSDPEIDELFKKSGESNDQEERKELYNEIFSKVQELAVYGAICNPYQLFAHNRELNCSQIGYEGFYYIYDFSWDSQKGGN
ncbi:MAG: ABC transporter substrate-binding protein [Lachnospiraceae bacterium]